MLSFLIPAYNSADVVAEAVESALTQSLDEEIEVVAVDDRSTDSTYAVLDSLAGRHAGLRVVRHPENRGGGLARNTAAANARGELLYMLDADNVLPEGCVQPQLDVMRRSGASAVGVGVQQFFDGTTRQRQHAWEQAQDGGWSRLRHMFESLQVPASHGNYLYTRALFDAVGGYEPDLGAMDTWSFGLKHIARGFDVAIVDGLHYLHRVNRPNRASYWSRDEQIGQNDRNAVTAIERQWDLIPSDIRAKVNALDVADPLFGSIAAGAFRQDVDLERFREIVDRAARDRARPPSRLSRLRAGVGRVLGR